MNLTVDPVETAEDLDWCARTMSGNDPWRALGRNYDACRASFSNPVKERYIVRAEGERVGLLILDMTGPFPGYLQSICVADGRRGCGVGAGIMAWAEARIFRESPNVFLCVSSFNPDAQRFYARLGYEVVGTLRRYISDEHDELLLRKTIGSMQGFAEAEGAGKR